MGLLVGIARAARKRAPLAEAFEAEVTLNLGLVGDARGAKPGRQVTVLFREGWEGACRDLGVSLPWTMRQANLLVEGVPVPREGARLSVGELVLEVTDETKPCQVMEAACTGLRRALTPEWRGGVTCRVVRGGTIRVGDRVEVWNEPSEPA
jgi:MOSC domain-containing protein YiiM